jgi:hypothetical protein
MILAITPVILFGLFAVFAVWRPTDAERRPPDYERPGHPDDWD